MRIDILVFTAALLIMCALGNTEESDKSEDTSCSNKVAEPAEDSIESSGVVALGIDEQHFLFRDRKELMCERGERDTVVLNLNVALGGILFQIIKQSSRGKDAKDKKKVSLYFKEIFQNYKKICIIGLDQYNIIEKSIPQSMLIDFIITEALLYGIKRIQLEKMILDGVPASIEENKNMVEELSFVEVHYVKPFIHIYQSIYYRKEAVFDAETCKKEGFEWLEYFSSMEEKELKVLQILELCIFMHSKGISQHHSIESIEDAGESLDPYLRNLMKKKSVRKDEIVRRYEKIFSSCMKEDSGKSIKNNINQSGKAQRTFINLEAAKLIAKITSGIVYQKESCSLFRLIDNCPLLAKIRIENSIFPDFTGVQKKEESKSMYSTEEKSGKNTLFIEKQTYRKLYLPNLKHIAIVATNFTYFDMILYINTKSLFSFTFCYFLDIEKNKGREEALESTCLEDIEVLVAKLESDMYATILSTIPCIGINLPMEKDMLVLEPFVEELKRDRKASNIEEADLKEEIKKIINNSIFRRVLERKKYLLITQNTLDYLLKEAIIALENLSRIYITNKKGSLLMSYYVEEEKNTAVRIYIHRFTIEIKDLYYFLKKVTRDFKEVLSVAIVVEAPPEELLRFIKSLSSLFPPYSSAPEKDPKEKNKVDIFNSWRELQNEAKIPIKKYFIFCKNYFEYYKVDFLWSIFIYDSLLRISAFTDFRSIGVPRSIFKCGNCRKTIETWSEFIFLFLEKSVSAEKNNLTDAAGEENSSKQNNANKKAGDTKKKEKAEKGFSPSSKLPVSAAENSKQSSINPELIEYTISKVQSQTLSTPYKAIFKMSAKDPIITYLDKVKENICAYSEMREIFQRIINKDIKYSFCNYNICSMQLLHRSAKAKKEEWNLTRKYVNRKIVKKYSTLYIDDPEILKEIGKKKKSPDNKKENRIGELVKILANKAEYKIKTQEDYIKKAKELLEYLADIFVCENINSSFLTTDEKKELFIYHKTAKDTPYESLKRHIVSQKELIGARGIVDKRKSVTLISEFRKEYLLLKSMFLLTEKEKKDFKETVLFSLNKNSLTKKIEKVNRSVKQIYKDMDTEIKNLGKEQADQIKICTAEPFSNLIGKASTNNHRYISTRSQPLCSTLYTLEDSLKPSSYIKGDKPEHYSYLCSQLIIDTLLDTDLLVSLSRINSSTDSAENEDIKKRKEELKICLANLKGEKLKETSSTKSTRPAESSVNDHLENAFKKIDSFYGLYSSYAHRATRKTSPDVKKETEKRRSKKSSNPLSTQLSLLTKSGDVDFAVDRNFLSSDLQEGLYAVPSFPSEWPEEAFSLTEGKALPIHIEKASESTSSKPNDLKSNKSKPDAHSITMENYKTIVFAANKRKAYVCKFKFKEEKKSTTSK